MIFLRQFRKTEPDLNIFSFCLHLLETHLYQMSLFALYCLTSHLRCPPADFYQKSKHILAPPGLKTNYNESLFDLKFFQTMVHVFMSL